MHKQSPQYSGVGGGEIGHWANIQTVSCQSERVMFRIISTAEPGWLNVRLQTKPLTSLLPLSRIKDLSKASAFPTCWGF
jgi:hypothetical protein